MSKRGVLNKTARQFNCKCQTKDGRRATVRLAPGFNIIEDGSWDHFVPLNSKGDIVAKDVDKYVAGLKKAGHIDFGKNFDEDTAIREADTVTKSKVVKPTGNTAEDLKGSKDAFVAEMAKITEDTKAAAAKVLEDAKAEAAKIVDDAKAEAAKAADDGL